MDRSNKGFRFFPWVIYLIFLFLLLTGCGRSISVFDQYSYMRTTVLKVDALHLMDKAVEDAGLHLEEIKNMEIEIEKIYEYEKGRPDNEISTRMWKILKDPGRNLLGGFLTRWKGEGSLKPVFISEAKLLIARGFDLIAELESGKIKPEEAAGSLSNIFNFIKE